MLSLEYLLEESKSAGLPIQKPRAILREYLQVIILNALYKSPLGERFFFRGRDIYDTIFMLQHQFPINESVLKANKLPLPIKKTLLDYLGTFQPSELKRLADQVRPFLFREEQADWVLKAPLFVETLLK